MGTWGRGEGAAASNARGGLAVDLLGGFRVTDRGAPVALPPTAQRLVAVVALRRRCARGRITGALWPELDDPQARACLRSTLWRIRRVAPPLVAADDGIAAMGEDVRVDVDEIVRAAHGLVAERGGSDRGDAVSAAAWPDLITGLDVVERELLPDWDDEWLIEDRERLRQLRLHALEALAEGLTCQGAYGQAMEAALVALRADRLRESAHRALIRVHLAEGNIAEALRSYDACCSTMLRELGLGPSRHTVELMSGARRAGRGAR